MCLLKRSTVRTRAVKVTSNLKQPCYRRIPKQLHKHTINVKTLRVIPESNGLNDLIKTLRAIL